MIVIIKVICLVFFFFKQKTAYEILTCDWSSDVCSSDLKKHNQKTIYMATEVFQKLV